MTKRTAALALRKTDIFYPKRDDSRRKGKEKVIQEDTENEGEEVTEEETMGNGGGESRARAVKEKKQKLKDPNKKGSSSEPRADLEDDVDLLKDDSDNDSDDDMKNKDPDFMIKKFSTKKPRASSLNRKKSPKQSKPAEVAPPLPPPPVKEPEQEFFVYLDEQENVRPVVHPSALPPVIGPLPLVRARLAAEIRFRDLVDSEDFPNLMKFFHIELPTLLQTLSELNDSHLMNEIVWILKNGTFIGDLSAYLPKAFKYKGEEYPPLAFRARMWGMYKLMGACMVHGYPIWKGCSLLLFLALKRDDFALTSLREYAKHVQKGEQKIDYGNNITPVELSVVRKYKGNVVYEYFNLSPPEHKHDRAGAKYIKDKRHTYYLYANHWTMHLADYACSDHWWNSHRQRQLAVGEEETKSHVEGISLHLKLTKAALRFVMVYCFCGGYYELRTKPVNQDEQLFHKIQQFFKLLSNLPRDMQELVCLRVAETGYDYIPLYMITACALNWMRQTKAQEIVVKIPDIPEGI